MASWPSIDNPTLTLAAQPATLTLPVCDNLPERPDIAPASAKAPKAAQIIIHRPPHNQRQIIKEQGQQASRVEIFDDYGELEFADYGIINSGIKRERYRILWNDPLSATADFHWTQELRRNAWHVRTETFTHMECDEEAYYLTGRVVAYEGEREIWQRDWQKSIRRS